MAIRVVIVDDDVWVRRGRAQLLAETPGTEVVAALGHSDALADPELWEAADVVLVDAWDRQAGFDRFPGVGVVRAIRSHPRCAEITVIVVTGQVVNDMLRLRMAEAGADLFYGHEELSDPERLTAAVLESCVERPSTGFAQAGKIHPDAALDWVRHHDVEEAFSGPTQKAIPFSRRTLGHIRREVAARAGIGASNKLAPWREVVRFVNRARGVELRRSPDEAHARRY